MKRIMGLLLLFLAVLSTSLFSACATTSQNTKIIPTIESTKTISPTPTRTASPTPTLEGVRAGKYTPQEYLNYLAQNMPEIMIPVAEGLIQEIIYNPPRLELEQLLTKLLRDLGYDDFIIADTLSSILENDENTAFQVLPAHPSLAGKKVPIYIIAHPYTINSLTNDYEVENILLHEIQHVKDIYYGVQLNNYNLNWQGLEKGEVSLELWKALLELRAYHVEVLNLFLSFRKNDKNYGDAYSKNICIRYSEQYSKLEKLATAPAEKLLKKEQLDSFKDLIPTYVGEDITINADVLGNKDFIVLRKK